MNSEEERATSDWWRWPLVPFAGFVGGSLGAIAFGLLQWLVIKIQGGFSEDGWYFLYILPIMTSAIFGYLFAFITHYVAPRGKFISAVVMTTVLGLFLLFSIALTWGALHESTAESIMATVGCVAAVVASIFSLIHLAQMDGTSP